MCWLVSAAKEAVTTEFSLSCRLLTASASSSVLGTPCRMEPDSFPHGASQIYEPLYQPDTLHHRYQEHRQDESTDESECEKLCVLHCHAIPLNLSQKLGFFLATNPIVDCFGSKMSRRFATYAAGFTPFLKCFSSYPSLRSLIARIDAVVGLIPQILATCSSDTQLFHSSINCSFLVLGVRLLASPPRRPAFRASSLLA